MIKQSDLHIGIDDEKYRPDEVRPQHRAFNTFRTAPPTFATKYLECAWGLFLAVVSVKACQPPVKPKKDYASGLPKNAT